MSVTLDGETFSLSDFRGLGHVEILPASTVGGGAASEPRWPDRIFRRMLTELEAADGVIQARDDAVAAAASTGATATSTSSLTIGTGSKSLTVQTGKAFVAGQSLKIAVTASPTTNYMVGVVTSYDSGTGAMVFTSQTIEGSGTYSAWSVSPTTGSVITDATISGGTIGGTVKQRTYTTRIREQGAVTQEDDRHVITFRRAVRLHNIDASTTTGTVTVDLKKNGTNIGGINGVSVSSSQTETAVDSGGNAYIDFAAGDKLSIDKSSVSAAENLEIFLDLEDR